jgi:protein TonB
MLTMMVRALPAILAQSRLTAFVLLSLLLHALLLWPPILSDVPAPPDEPAAAEHFPLPVLETRLRPVDESSPPPAPEAMLTTTAARTATVPLRPVAVPPAPTFASVPQRLEGEALQTALATLASEDFYPAAAIARGLEGQVIVLLGLSAQGEVLSATLASSSGHAILDTAALRAVRRIARLPTAQRQVLLPVHFQLE